MICKHECPICGLEYEHLCNTPPKEPLGFIIVLAYDIEYMPPCNIKDYFMLCNDCRYNREKFK